MPYDNEEGGEIKHKHDLAEQSEAADTNAPNMGSNWIHVTEYLQYKIKARCVSVQDTMHIHFM